MCWDAADRPMPHDQDPPFLPDVDDGSIPGTPAAGRRVVLVLGESPPSASTRRYVLNCCPRVQAGLDILYPSGLQSWRLRGLLRALAGSGVRWRALPFEGDVRHAVAARLRGDMPVIFVVLDRALSAYPAAAPWKTLGCPVVMP